MSSSIDLASLDGLNGFRLDGPGAAYGSGFSVASAGDVNGDSFADIFVGGANGGDSHVVFGKADWSGTATLNLSTLDGTNGFRLDGAAGDLTGRSVACAGDVNGDGLDDLIVGGFQASPGGDFAAGQVHVVFGKADSSGTPTLDLSTLDGSGRLLRDGIAPDDNSGRAVASAGDVNGDGFADLIIAAYRADPGGDSSAGESYVVFGKADWSATLNFDLSTLNGTNGFRLDEIDPQDYSGASVASAGDVNGDGFDDIIIGATGADPGGKSYVVFGKADWSATPAVDLSTLDGTNGFRLDGIVAATQRLFGGLGGRRECRRFRRHCHRRVPSRGRFRLPSRGKFRGVRPATRYRRQPHRHQRQPDPRRRRFRRHALRSWRQRYIMGPRRQRYPRWRRGQRDTAVYFGAWINYTITGGGTLTITDTRGGAPDGVDTVSNVENFRFSNGTFTAGQIANDAPTDIALSAATTAENAANATVVGSLSRTDADIALGDTASYTLVDNAGGRFGISGDNLIVADGSLLDREASASIT